MGEYIVIQAIIVNNLLSVQYRKRKPFFKHNIGQDKRQIGILTFTSQNGPAGSALQRAAPPPASVGFPASAASLSHPSGRAGSIAAGAASSLSASRAASWSASLAASLPSTPSAVAEWRPPSLGGVLSHSLRHASPHPVRALLAEVLLWPLGGPLPARGFILLLLGSLLVYKGFEPSRG